MATTDDDRITLGRFGERLAERYLIAQGYRILARNWRGRAGELDLIAVHGEVIVVCEVKTRRTERFGPPAAAVSPAQQERQHQLAAEWQQENGLQTAPVRLDVIGVLVRPGKPAQLEHLRGVG